MSSLMYWTLFLLLIVLLITLGGYLFCTILWDCMSGRDYSQTDLPLNKHDVEDLTRFQRDYRTVIPKDSVSSEVEDIRIQEMLGRKYSNLDNRQILSSQQEDSEANQTPKSFKERSKISQSVYDLEFCDPNSIDTLRVLGNMEEEARRVEEEIQAFRGNNDLRYYETNEKLLHLMISVTELYCEREEVRMRKSSILECIQTVQKKLKNGRSQ